MANRVRAKFCGMTCQEDIAYAVNLGVDALGFIFYADSARYISLDTAATLFTRIPAFVDKVAVLVNPDVAFVWKVLNTLPVQWLQFHGEETRAFCEQFNVPYIKAVRVTSKQSIASAIADYPSADALLLDTPAVGAYGGSGQCFDWQCIPGDSSKPLILAGGLTPGNVGTAVKIAHPFAVDVCSGLEARPGVKDPVKMNAFMKALGGSNDA